MKHTVFIVEDEPGTRDLYRFWLKKCGYSCTCFEQAEPCLALLDTMEPSAICLDLGLPGMPGLEAIEKIRESRPEVPVIVLTGENDAAVGVKAMKLGASDYIVKPVDREAFENTVSIALKHYELIHQVRALRTEAKRMRAGKEIIGKSDSMARVVKQIGLVLDNDVPVFIEGDTGTGKELIANTIHSNSTRSEKPFVAVNCGAIPKDLQESQFFGHEKGSFTDALNQHIGFFEEANGGTIFLDEVTELSPEAQVKLLRVLQEHKVRRVGGSSDIPIDVRIISASNRDTRTMIDSGAFRQDLYFRLMVFPIVVPPLKERSADIPLLVGHFLKIYSEAMKQEVPDITHEALEFLVGYSWPGNIRELQNALRFAILACQGDAIIPDHLPPDIRTGKRNEDIRDSRDNVSLIDPITGSVKSFARMELEILLRVRDLAGGSVGKAAAMIGIGRATFYRRMQSIEKIISSPSPQKADESEE